jgi:hypothetical protein
MIKEFAAWIAAQVPPVGLPPLVVGENLYVGWMPETAAGLRSVVREITPAPVQAADSRIITKPFQLLAIGATYHTTRELVEWLATAIINAVSPEIDDAFEFMSITGSEPGYLGVNKKNEHEFAVNVTARVRRK